jgi:hypothetical protein
MAKEIDMSLPPVVSPKELAQSLQQILQQFSEKTSPDAEFGVKERLSVKDWLATAQAICQAAKNSTPELVRIEQMTMALRYRMVQMSEKPAPEPLEPLLSSIRHQHPVLFSNKDLEEFSRKQIDYLSRHYPEFAKRLSAQLQKTPDEWALNFIKFCLQAPSQSWYRDKQATHWIDIFIKYPEIADQLMKCGIYEKLGLYPENIAILTDNGVCLKICLNDRVSYVPIKKPLEQHLLKNIAQENQPYSTTLAEIFHEFEVSSSPGFSVCTNGVINLNSLLLGSKKNKDGAIALINPKRWTEYKPCIELTLPDLQKLWPINGEPAFGFVLRADRQFPSLTQAKSQAFFDFVMRLENGNYRVITMNSDQGHGVYLREQKMAFYPLSDQQGKKVSEMVAKDIEKYRTSHGNGKLVPYIDIEPYIDEVLGHNFYEFLEGLVEKLENKEQNPRECEKIKKQLSLAKQTLDPEDFEKFLSPLIDKLVKTRDIPPIHQLIEKSLVTLKFLLQKEADKIPLPKQEDVESAARTVYNKDEEGRVLRESLLALTRLCFVALHPYSVKATEAERSTPIIGKIFQIVQSIPWKWLRDLLSDFLLLILGPFRGYRYLKPDGASENRIYKLVQTIRNWQPTRYLNRPSQFFSKYDETVLRQTVEDITKHLNVLAPAARS